MHVTDEELAYLDRCITNAGRSLKALDNEAQEAAAQISDRETRIKTAVAYRRVERDEVARSLSRFKNLRSAFASEAALTDTQAVSLDCMRSAMAGDSLEDARASLAGLSDSDVSEDPACSANPLLADAAWRSGRRPNPVMAAKAKEQDADFSPNANPLIADAHKRRAAARR